MQPPDNARLAVSRRVVPSPCHQQVDHELSKQNKLKINSHCVCLATENFCFIAGLYPDPVALVLLSSCVVTIKCSKLEAHDK